MARKVRILVIATNNWSSIGQLLSAFIRVGFEIAIVCPPGSPIEHINNLSARYKYRRWCSQQSIRAAIADWSPFFLVCNDEVAVRELHNIHRQTSSKANDAESGELIELIERSLGDRRTFSTSRSKSRFISVAQALNVACPPTIVVNSYGDLDRHLDGLVYPTFIKLDESWGGRGVRLAYTDRELSLAVLELSFPYVWPKSFKRLLAKVIEALPVFLRPPFPQKLSLQRPIWGRPANRAVVCWQGKILAGITIEAIETGSDFGPTTLARIIDHAEITDAVERVVKAGKWSGFLGFDFMLDEKNRAWFLEMNPRVTPACHLRLKAPSLPAALFLQLTGELPASDTREVPEERIALFPNRVSKKAALQPYFDDTPEGEPAFLQACHRPQLLRMIAGRINFRGAAYKQLDKKITNTIVLEKDK